MTEFTGPFCDLFYIQFLDTFQLCRIHNQANLAGKVIMGYELNQIWSQVPSHDQGCVTCMHGNACTRHEVPRRDPSLLFRRGKVNLLVCISTPPTFGPILEGNDPQCTILPWPSSPHS